MNSQRDDSSQHRLVHGYERMMERAKAVLSQAKKGTIPNLRQLIDHGEEKAVELGELTKEEAEKIGNYLHRDLYDAAHYLSYTGRSLADWLNFDLDLVEAELMDIFSAMVDHTRLELDQIAERARRSEELHTGEVTGPGTLRCLQCDEELHFRTTGHIPPCPKCHSSEFRRLTYDEADT